MTDQVRRTTRNSLLWNGVALSLALLLLGLGSRYFYFVYRGPVVYDDAGLLALIEAEGTRSLVEYVELRDRQLIATDMKEVSTKNGKAYSEFPFFLTPVGDRLLLVLARSPADGARLVGPLGPWSSVETEVVASLRAQSPELKGKLLPVTLNSVAAFPVFAYVALVALTPWLLVFGYKFFRALLARLNPPRHAIYRQLERFGDARQLAEQIDRDVASGAQIQVGAAVMTPRWILRPTKFSALCVPYGEIVWAYEFRNPGATVTALFLRDRRVISLPLSSTDSARLVSLISVRAPWAYCGFDEELIKRWRTDPASVIAEVEQRRQTNLGEST